MAFIIASTHKFKIGIAIGFFFLTGGIVNSVMLPSPTWFIVVDLVCAYLPMAYLGIKLASIKKGI